MVTTRWYENGIVNPDRSYTALLGYLQLNSFRTFAKFVWYGRQIESQMKRTPEVLGYRIQARFSGLEFWHLSAWEDSTAIHAFVHAQPHLQIMEELAGRLGKTEFRYWRVKGSDLPLHFEQELHRLAASPDAETHTKLNRVTEL